MLYCWCFSSRTSYLILAWYTLINTVFITYFVKIAPLIKWPQRDVLHETMSVSFIPVIIHCTDLFARTQVWIYKHPSTDKFLIGIVYHKDNLISFLSLYVGKECLIRKWQSNQGLTAFLPGSCISCHTCTERYFIQGYSITRQRSHNWWVC